MSAHGKSSVGELLRWYRQQLGLTQAELGTCARLSERAISDIERDLKVPQAATLRLLCDALKLPSDAREEFETARRRARQASSPGPSGGRLPERSLPDARTSFIGREREVAEVRQCLSSSRLVTLTGAGGTGKTRVAFEAAVSVQAEYPDGVVFVGVAPVSDPGMVMASVASVLGLTDDGRRSALQAVQNALRRRRVLLILDNFEQVLEAALDVDRLLAECPSVQVLVTSREPLRISGEQELTIPPLERSESVRLFVERATAINRDFLLSAQNAAAVAEICRQVDDLPLAIELAAARSRLLEPHDMLGRLERRLPLLTGGARDMPLRQQTLRNTIAWSYDLLEPTEQTVFRHLAVFVGGCTLESAQIVCAPDHEDVLPYIESLVAKNLLRTSNAAGSDTRVVMLETVREFGLEQLAGSAELDALRLRHAEYFVRLAEESEHQLSGLEAPLWLARLEAEHDNLRAVMEWSLGHPEVAGEIAARVAGALGRFWWMAGHFGEGSRWLTRALDGDSTPSLTRMKALHAAGWLAHVQRESERARALLSESLAIAEQRGDDWWRAWGLHTLGRVAYFENDALRAAELGQNSLRIAERLADAWLTAWALHLLGLAAYVAGDYEAAHASYERSVAMRRELGHLEGLVIALHLEGVAMYRLGGTDAALQLVREALEIARQLNSNWFYICLLPIFASFAALHQPRRAARLAGAVASLCESTQTLPIPITEALFNEGTEIARRKLGDAAFDSAWAEGQMLSLEAAVAEAEAVEIR